MYIIPSVDVEMVKMKKAEYTFTEEEMTELLNYIVSVYSRKKFTEDDLKRVIDGNEKNRKQTFTHKLRENNKGESQLESFGNNRQELLESEKKEYKDIAYNLGELVEDESKGPLDNFTKMELKCKNNDKIWMYKVDEDILVIKEGLINKKLKEETINFNDEDQLECYLNKQIILKKNRGYVEI